MVQTLRQRLQTNQDVFQKIETIRAIGRLGAKGADAVNDLHLLFSSKDELVRAAVAWSLGQIGAKASLPLLQKGAFKDPKKIVRASCMEALVGYGTKAVSMLPAFCKALSDRDKWVQLEAARAIRAFGAAGAPCVRALGAAYSSTYSNMVKKSFAWTLGKLGPEAKSTATTLAVGLDRLDNQTKFTVAWALGQIGVKNRNVVYNLRRLLSNEAILVRQMARQALRQLGLPNAKPLEQKKPINTALTATETILGVQQPHDVKLPPVPDKPALDAKSELEVQEKLASIDAFKAKSWRVKFAPDAMWKPVAKIGPGAAGLVVASIENERKGNKRRVQLRTYIKILANMHPKPHSAIPTLASLLSIGNYRVRKDAAKILPLFGPHVVPYLLKVLDSKNYSARNSAHSILSAGYSGYAVPSLIKALKANKNWSKRYRLRGTLAAAGAVALPSLVGLLSHSNIDVAIEAAKAIRTLATKQKEVAKAALPALKFYFPRGRKGIKWYTLMKLRRAIADAILAIEGDKAVDFFIQYVSGSDRWLASVASGRLGKCGPSAIPALLKLLKHPDNKLRRAGAQSFQRLREKAAPAIPELLKLLRDPYYPGKRALIKIFENIGPKAKVATPDLFKALNEPKLADAAASTIANLKIDHKIAVPKLIKALEGMTGWKRRGPINALAKYKEHALPALPLARKLLKENSRGLLSSLLYLISSVGPKASVVVPDLIPLLKGASSYTRGKVAEALGSFGAKSAKAVPALIKAFENETGWKKRTYAKALGMIGPAAASAAPALAAFYKKTTSSWTKREVLEALGQFGPKASKTVLPILEAALFSGKWAMYKRATRLLPNFGKAGQAILMKGLQDKKTLKHVLSGLRDLKPAQLRPYLPVVMEEFKGKNTWYTTVVLRKFGKSILPKLQKIYPTAGVRVRHAIIDLHRYNLKSAKDPSVTFLVEQLAQGKRFYTKLRIVDTLLKIDPKSTSFYAMFFRVAAEKPGSYTVRRMMKRLYSKPTPQAVGSLKQQLVTADTKTKKIILGLLHRWGKKALPMLPILKTSSLFDADGGVRADAAAVIGKMGPLARSAVSPLMALFADTTPRAIANALWATAHVHPASLIVKKVTGFLSHENSMVRYQAAFALSKLGKRAASATDELLKVMMSDRSAKARFFAAVALRKIDTPTPAVLSSFLQGMKDHSKLVRGAVKRGLTQWSEKIFLVVKSDILSKDPKKRELGLDVLGELSLQKPASVKALGQLFTSKDEAVLKVALRALGKSGKAGKSMASKLLPLLKDSRWKVRHAALSTYGKLVDSYGKDGKYVLGLLEDPQWQVRALAAKVLGSWGVSAKGTLKVLISVLKKDSIFVQNQAWFAIVAIEG
tara:strand:+ start:2782 stop:6858 length:4077 start_codon:yes stop_codon:yes gene_type:complete